MNDMKKSEYLERLGDVAIDEKRANKVKEIYSKDLPDVILKIVTIAGESEFFDDGTRILSYQEIIDAENDLHVAFSQYSIIPVADCGENDFIIYNYADGYWAKFNIIDESIFKKKKKISELLV